MASVGHADTSAPAVNGTSPSADQQSTAQNPSQHGVTSVDERRTAANVKSQGNERVKEDNRDAEPKEDSRDTERVKEERRAAEREPSHRNGVADRRRSRSPDPDAARPRGSYRLRDDRRDDRYVPRSAFRGKFRGPNRRSTSLSDEDRHYRPSSRHEDSRDRPRNSSSRDQEPDRDRDRSRDRNDNPNRSNRGRHREYRDREDRRRSSRSGSPHRSPAPDDEMDRRTVFVNQLANRLKERQLEKFFEDNVGPVVAANIVRDRVSLRSKGVGYVQFKQEESVPKALNMTGRNLMGIPIIVQLTEAEKNRQAKAAANQTSSGTAPFHRLYVGNVHFSITEDDLRSVFSAYGAIEYVSLQTDDSGRSRGYGFVQFADAKHAKKALDEMNGFDLAGRALRVGLGNDKNHEAAQARVGPQAASFSGAGGRGVHAGGQHNYERAAHRDTERLGGASALDDTDVANVNVHSFDRFSLMKKLAREEDATTTAKATTIPSQHPAVPTPLSQQLSRCIVITNAFATAEEDEKAPSGRWVKEIEDDIEQECVQEFGVVIHIKAVRADGQDASQDGRVYIKFRRAEFALMAYQSLQGRNFNNRMIAAEYVPEGQYNLLHRLP